jgi:hypothetical protein
MDWLGLDWLNGHVELRAFGRVEQGISRAAALVVAEDVLVPVEVQVGGVEQRAGLRLRRGQFRGRRLRRDHDLLAVRATHLLAEELGADGHQAATVAALEIQRLHR